MRKRVKPPSSQGGRPQKRRKVDTGSGCPLLPFSPIQHPTLRLYYSQIFTLRDYLLSRLPASASKARVRRLTVAGLETNVSTTQEEDGSNDSTPQTGSEKGLAALLDQSFVCLNDSSAEKELESVEKEFVIFSQQSMLSPDSSFEKGTALQSEVSRLSPFQSSFPGLATFILARSFGCRFFQRPSNPARHPSSC